MKPILVKGRKKAEKIILANERDLTKEIVNHYTESEVREWMRLLGYKYQK